MRAVSRSVGPPSYEDSAKLTSSTIWRARRRRRRPRRARASRSASAGHAKRASTSRRAAAPRRRALRGVRRSPAASARASAASSSGSTSHPVWPGRTMSAGPKRSTATAGRPQAMPSTSAEPNCSRTEASTTTSAAAKNARQRVVLVPAGEEDVARAGRADRVVGVLALPLARVAAQDHERRAGAGSRVARAGEGAHEQPDALDLGEAADREDDRRRWRRRARLLGACSATEPSSLARPPAVRVARPGLAPERGAVDRRAARSARGRSRWARSRSARGSTPSSPLGALDLAVRAAGAGARSRRPSGASAAPTPRRGPSPRARRRRCARASSSSVPCRWPTTGTSGATRAAASWIGVRWWRCRTSASAAPARSSARAPGRDVGRVGVVVEGGEDAVGRVGAVLVGRVHRGVAARRSRTACDVEARVEALGVAGDRACEPETTVTSQPCAGSSRASARATCAEPPRGKNMRALTRRTPHVYSTERSASAVEDRRAGAGARPPPPGGCGPGGARRWLRRCQRAPASAVNVP